MKLKVLKLEDNNIGKDLWICEDEEGIKHRVDLLVSGDIKVENNKDLIGKTIYTNYLHPYIELIGNCYIVE